MVRDFPKSPNQPNEMALSICNSIFRLIRDWKLESFANGKEISAVPFRTEKEEYLGCLPFVRIIRLGRAFTNGKGFSKITKPTERNGAYHLQFDFPSLFSADERLETGSFANGKEISAVPFRTEKEKKVLHNLRMQFPENYLTI